MVSQQSCNTEKVSISWTNIVHFLLLLFSRAFYVYPLLFCSLQYIYESLYRSYPSVCLCRIQRQPESHSLSCLDHANNLRLLIRFQHDLELIERCRIVAPDAQTYLLSLSKVRIKHAGSSSYIIGHQRIIS